LYLHLSFLLSFVFLVVIPEGDLLLSLSVLLAFDQTSHMTAKEPPTHHNSPRKAHHHARASWVSLQ